MKDINVAFDENFSRTPIFVKLSELVLLMTFCESEFVEKKRSVSVPSASVNVHL